MERVLDAIFHGELYPSEKILPTTESYRSSLKEADKLVRQLKEQLSATQFELFEAYCSEKAGMAGEMQCECFRRGAILGVRLWKEINPD